MKEAISSSIRQTSSLAELEKLVQGFSKKDKESHVKEISKKAILLAKHDSKINLIEARNRFRTINESLPAEKKAHGLIDRISARIFPTRTRTLDQMEKEIIKSRALKPKLYGQLVKLHPEIDMSEEAVAQGLPRLLFAKKMKYLADLKPDFKNVRATKNLAHQIERIKGPLTSTQVLNVKQNLMQVLRDMPLQYQGMTWKALDAAIREKAEVVPTSAADALASIELIRAAEPDSKGFIPLTRDELKKILQEVTNVKEHVFGHQEHPIVFDANGKRTQDLDSPAALKAVRMDFDLAKPMLPIESARGKAIVDTLLHYEPLKVENHLEKLKKWPDATALCDELEKLFRENGPVPMKEIAMFLHVEEPDLKTRVAWVVRIADSLYHMGFVKEAIQIYATAKGIAHSKWQEPRLSPDFERFIERRSAQRVRG